MNHRRSALAWQTLFAAASMVGSVGCVAVGPGCGGVVGCGCEPGCDPAGATPFCDIAVGTCTDAGNLPGSAQTPLGRPPG